MNLRSLKSLFKRLGRDESGSAVMEYALIAGLVIVGVIATIGAVGPKVLARWTSVNASL